MRLFTVTKEDWEKTNRRIDELEAHNDFLLAELVEFFNQKSNLKNKKNHNNDDKDDDNSSSSSSNTSSSSSSSNSNNTEKKVEKRKKKSTNQSSEYDEYCRILFDELHNTLNNEKLEIFKNDEGQSVFNCWYCQNKDKDKSKAYKLKGMSALFQHCNTKTHKSNAKNDDKILDQLQNLNDKKDRSKLINVLKQLKEDRVNGKDNHSKILEFGKLVHEEAIKNCIDLTK